jgi:hypothetical protein
VSDAVIVALVMVTGVPERLKTKVADASGMLIDPVPPAAG